MRAAYQVDVLPGGQPGCAAQEAGFAVCRSCRVELALVQQCVSRDQGRTARDVRLVVAQGRVPQGVGNPRDGPRVRVGGPRGLDFHELGLPAPRRRGPPLEAVTCQPSEPGRLHCVAEQQRGAGLDQLDLAEVLAIPVGVRGGGLAKGVPCFGDQSRFEQDAGTVEQGDPPLDIDGHRIRPVHEGERGRQVATQVLHVAKVVDGGELEVRLARAAREPSATGEVGRGLLQLHQLGGQGSTVEQQLGAVIQGQQVQASAGPVHPSQRLGEVAAAPVHRGPLHVAEADQVRPLHRLGLLDRLAKDQLSGAKALLLESHPAFGQGHPHERLAASGVGEQLWFGRRHCASLAQQARRQVGSVPGELVLGLRDVSLDGVQGWPGPRLRGVPCGPAH